MFFISGASSMILPWQTIWFGEGAAGRSRAKILVDQFIFTVFWANLSNADDSLAELRYSAAVFGWN